MSFAQTRGRVMPVGIVALAGVALAFGGVLATGGPARADDLTHTVSGTVTDWNGEPVEGATVQANPPGDFSGESTTTDSSGEYILQDVRATDTIINTFAYDPDAGHQYTDAQVYYSQQFWQDAASIADATALTVDPGDTATGIDFQLVRQDAIHQLITDSTDEAIPCVGVTPWLLNEATGNYEQAVGGPYYTGRDGYLNFAVAAGSTYKILYSDNLSSDDPGCPAAPLSRTEPFESHWYGGTSLATATAVHADGGQITLPTLTLQPFSGPISLTGTPSIVPGSDDPTTVHLEGLGVSPGDATLAFQWMRDDSPIDGETGAAHALTEADHGTVLTVQITATRPGDPTQTFTSNPLNLRDSFTTTPVPTITGTPVVGETLTADAGTWIPAQDSLSYQWLRGATPVVGATSATLVLTGDDLGASLKVAVTASKAGFDDATTVSDVTTPVGAGTLTVGTPTISGSPTFGAVLTVDPGTWGPGAVVNTYQWVSGSTDIAGATAASYWPTAADVGHRLWVRVTGAEAGYVTASANSSQTAGIGAATFLSAPRPTISGATAVGQTLTADPGSWGPGTVTFAYQWQNEGVTIAGATASTYSPVAADVGDQLTVRVTGSEFGFTDATSTSLPTVPIDKGTLTPGTPSVSGTAVYGQTLTASPGSWAPTGVTFAYQWLRGGAVIAGATSSTYALAPEDVGSTISVRVTGSKSGYNDAPADSDPTATVISGTLTTGTPSISGGLVFGATLTATPGAWTPNTVSFGYQWRRNGTPLVGATSSTYTLAPTDVDAFISVRVTGSQPGYTSASVTAPGGVISPATFTTTPTPTLSGPGSLTRQLTAVTQPWIPSQDAFTYQWLRNGSPIAGATASKYTLAVIDSNTAISVIETGAKAGYAAVTKTSAAYLAGTILPRFDQSAEVPPTVTGDATVGEVLTTTNGTWSPMPDSYSYVWARGTGDAGGFTPIQGATASTYTLVAADAGKSIVARVTASKAGYDTAFTTQVSAETDVVELGTLASTKPTITHPGAGPVKFPLTLTAVPGAWGPGTPTFSFQWLRDGTAISGGAGGTYALQPADVGAAISVRVTGSESGFADSTQDSTATSTVLAGEFAGTPDSPTITGTAQVGKVLTAVDPSWSPATTFSHQWMRDGTDIVGATGASYAPTALDEEHAISVRVTSLLPGFTAQSKASDETSDVLEGTFIAVAKPTITGTARVGSTLTAHAGTWTPAITDFVYTWKIGTATIGTGPTYVPVAANITHAITVTVASNADGYAPSTSAPSTATAKVVAGLLSGVTPTVTGTARVGQLLTATLANSWTPVTTALHYQWLRAGKSISGATHSTYTTTTSDYKKSLSVKISGSLSGYTTVVKTSKSITIAAGSLTTAIPTITGTPAVGSKLTAVRGTWGPGTVSFKYQWYRSGTAISGATASTYTVGSTSLGKTITVKVTGSKTDYATISKTSASTAVVARGEFTTVGTPTITGSLSVGSKLTAHTGTWSPTTSVTFTYRWYRLASSSATPVPISGATASTRTLTAADRGYFLQLTVTATRSGFTTESASVGTGSPAT